MNAAWYRVSSAVAICLGVASSPAGAAPAQADRELAVCSDPSNLPYSDDRLQGFENRIAQLLAADLKASLRYTWNMQRRSFLRRTLNAGECDVVIGSPAGLRGMIQSRPYYASSYVFVTAKHRQLELTGFDDPRLRELKIGLQAVGAEGANTPPASALARRGIVGRIVGFPVWGEEDDATPQARIIDAVASGEIDVAIVWGPIAGYFARRHGDELLLRPADADPQQPQLAFRYAMALGVRRDDAALLEELQSSLDRHQADIQDILRTYGVPLSGLPEPTTLATSTRGK